jgi:hypothetical protein
MSFVTCWDEYEYTTSNTYNLGDVVEVFDVEDEDIEDVAAIAGKDPEEYKNVGFFESSAGSKLKNTLKESAIAINEQEVDACLKRINSKVMQPECDKDWCDVNVHLSKDDLKKALRIGNDGEYGMANRGSVIPAQLVNEAIIVFEPADENSSSLITLQLHGEHPETGESVHDYVDGLPWIGSITVIDKFTTDEEAADYFKTEVLPEANKLAHDIIENAWKAGYSDYNGITDYKAPRIDGTSNYAVVFKDDINTPVYSGNKPDCENFIREIQHKAYAIMHGGVELIKE